MLMRPSNGSWVFDSLNLVQEEMRPFDVVTSAMDSFEWSRATVRANWYYEGVR